jgi:hypothetical protein
VTLCALCSKLRWRALSAAICLLLVSTCGLPASPLPPAPAAQKGQSSAQDYALIYGTVWTAEDRPAVGVPITIRRSGDTKPKWKLVSDQRGEFAQRVPTGKDDYIVQADIKVPKGESKPEITVKIDNNEREDVSLHLKSVVSTSK